MRVMSEQSSLNLSFWIKLAWILSIRFLPLWPFPYWRINLIGYEVFIIFSTKLIHVCFLLSPFIYYFNSRNHLIRYFISYEITTFISQIILIQVFNPLLLSKPTMILVIPYFQTPEFLLTSLFQSHHSLYLFFPQNVYTSISVRQIFSFPNSL